MQTIPPQEVNLVRQELKILRKAYHNADYCCGRAQVILAQDSQTFSEEDFADLDAYAARFLRLNEVLFNQVLVLY